MQASLYSILSLTRPIPKEIIRLLTPSEALEYRLVPYQFLSGKIYCYGEIGHDYSQAILELEVLSGWRIEVTDVSDEQMRQLMAQYYRPKPTATAVAATTGPVKGNASENYSGIAAGQNFLMTLIGSAYRDRASDIHIEPYEERCRIRMRIDGKLAERCVIERPQYAPLVNQIKILASLDIAEKRLPQDGQLFYDRDGNRFDVRVSTLPTIHGEKIVLRLLTRPSELLELRNLGFTERQYRDYCRAIERSSGMVLICGPAGSGKSTTLYATLRRMNTLTDNILTIEDPIECTLEGVNQVQLKEEIGLTFPSALRTFLRQDPDVILLGEIRDTATAQMAVRSTLTGHLLFSTIHAHSAWGAVARLRDLGVHPCMVAETLAMTVAQRLVRLLCPHCKRSTPMTEEVRRLLPGCEAESYAEATGCKECFHTGYSGRMALYEVIPLDDGLAEAARAGRTDIEPMLQERGITTIRQAAVGNFLAARTSFEEIAPLLC